MSDPRPPRLWIGGSTCSGKSTFARELSRMTGYRVYSADETFQEHAHRIRFGTTARIARMAVCERLAQPVGVQAADVWTIAQERWELIRADLVQIYAPVIVEGECLIPENVAALETGENRAIFLLATPGVRRARYATRGWAVDLVARCPDPPAAFEAWMSRDDLVEARIADGALAAGLKTCSSPDLDELARVRNAMVAAATPH